MSSRAYGTAGRRTCGRNFALREDVIPDPRSGRGIWAGRRKNAAPVQGGRIGIRFWPQRFSEFAETRAWRARRTARAASTTRDEIEDGGRSAVRLRAGRLVSIRIWADLVRASGAAGLLIMAAIPAVTTDVDEREKMRRRPLAPERSAPRRKSSQPSTHSRKNATPPAYERAAPSPKRTLWRCADSPIGSSAT